MEFSLLSDDILKVVALSAFCTLYIVQKLNKIITVIFYCDTCCISVVLLNNRLFVMVGVKVGW